MKKTYLLGGLILILLIGVLLWTRPRTPVAEPAPVASAVVPVGPAKATPAEPALQPKAVSEANPGAVVMDANKHPVIPGQILDASGRLLEEKVASPDGDGYVIKRYSYDGQGRVQIELHIAENGTIERLDYTYDADGSANVRCSTATGHVAPR